MRFSLLASLLLVSASLVWAPFFLAAAPRGTPVPAQEPGQQRVVVKPTNEEGEAASQSPPRAERIGLRAARSRLGPQMPTGRGVVAAHVEGEKGAYAPKGGRAFGDTAIVAKSGPSEPFGHATHTARTLYGSNGLAPGVRVVHAFAVNHWLSGGYLRTGSGQPPKQTRVRLVNHSWVGNPGRKARPVLRRVDYQADAGNVVMCAGVNNGRDSKVPHILSSAYNAIVVGTADGSSSGGYTRIETKGRCKPDVAAPAGTTSEATAVMTAMAARLLEAGERRAANADSGPASAATRAEVIKALLLAGATKPAGWQPESDKPLDNRLGAGVVQIDHSLALMEQGPEGPGRLGRRYGWDFRGLEPGQRRVYRFELHEAMGEISLVLNWHRRVDGTSGRFRFGDSDEWSYAAALANFDLRLVRLRPDGTREPVAASTSAIDNVEHIYQPKLKAGRYRLIVERREDGYVNPWEYALAWRIER